MKLIILLTLFISTSASAKSVFIAFTKEVVRGAIFESHYAEIEDFDHNANYSCVPKSYPEGIIDFHGSGYFENEIGVTIMSFDGKFSSVSKYINYFEDSKAVAYHHQSGVLSRLSLISESEFVRITGDKSVAVPLIKDHSEVFRNIIANESWRC